MGVATMALVASPQTPIKAGSCPSAGFMTGVIGDSSSSNDDVDDDSSSIISFVSAESSSDSDDYLSSEDERNIDRKYSNSRAEAEELRSPSVRKSRTRTVEVHSPMKHVASSDDCVH